MNLYLEAVSTWLVSRLTEALGDSVAAEALAMGAEVMLTFEEEPMETRIAQTISFLREDGVDKKVLDDFANELLQIGL